MQNQDKIGVKFYTKRASAKSANFLQNLRRNFTAKSSFKARQKSAQKSKSRRRKILAMKFRLQISLGKIALDMGRDLNSRQIFRAKFYAKIRIKPAKFIVNFFGRNSLRL